MPRGWRGPMRTTGGLTRTYGLHRHFSREDRDGRLPGLRSASLRRIARYFRPYWRWWVIILLCVGVMAGLNVLPPICVARIIDVAIPQEDEVLLALLAGAMVGLALVSGLISVLQRTLTTRTGQSIMFDLRNELYQHLQRMSLGFYTATRSGEIVSRINNDVNAVQGVTTRTLVAIASNLATLAATSIALFSMNWRLALVAIAIVPAFYLPSRIVGRIRRRLSTRTQESQASLLAFMSERLHVGGSILTKIFGQEAADAETFAERSADVRDLRVRQAVVGRWLFMILSVFSAVGPALIYWYGGLEVIRQELTTGLLVAFAALLGLLYRPLTQLATVYVDIQASVAVFERIFEYLDLAPDVKDKPDRRELEQVRGRIAFEGVEFAYPTPLAIFTDEEEEGEADRPEPFALHDVTFTIEPGEQVALVGPSGAGKTTITYLVPRFYDPDQGRISLDGHDLRHLDQGALRRHMAMVTQETFLFHASIRENLLYANPGAREDELVAACRAAHIHEFVETLPDRYETVVGERGFRLSGGEKQRVSIARALLKDPDILILDEATSNLDATSEYLIQQALETLLRGRTSLIIAHRLSTILSSDKIVVMDEGRVVDIGRHEELVERGGLYATLFHQQFGKVLDADGR
ncbi:MAG: ABC transporter ATP-binding protein [Planctomycetota bacterium]